MMLAVPVAGLGGGSMFVYVVRISASSTTTQKDPMCTKNWSCKAEQIVLLVNPGQRSPCPVQHLLLSHSAPLLGAVTTEKHFADTPAFRRVLRHSQHKAQKRPHCP